MRFFVVLAVAGTLVACGSASQNETLFSLLPPDSTGVTFVNEVEGEPGRNLFTYENFFNGGGVAAGDVNGDGRPDLYFTANMGPNALYLNRGDMQFEEVTERAGVRGDTGWATGVTMTDVNGDGLLDLYVCHAGPEGTEDRRNKLYVNQGPDANGVPRFEEKAAAYGVNDPGYSTHATFFDYDRDGDLDLYVLNNHPPAPKKPRRLAGDKLYRHDTDASGTSTFVEVTEQAGLIQEPVGYGLSVTVSDLNRDGWPDVYVANDFETEDRLYVNQGDGTFTDAIHEWIDHMSTSSMGADIADYNNDARPDIFVADMLAEDNRRQKLLAITPTPRFQETFQYTRNMLQLNQGDPAAKSGEALAFSEIGQLAGVSNTDWSWATLFADFDLDGWKDLYVTNGVPRDQTNLDFQYSDRMSVQRQQRLDPDTLFKLVQQIPSTPLPNYAFRNQGDLTFAKASADWGVDQKGFSNGAAYADLDGDGDLDLAVSNVNNRAWVYRNETAERTGHHYLRVDLQGTGRNRQGIGAKVELTAPDGRTFFQEMMPARGFQSSMEPVLTFGLGEAEEVDLTVTWPDQTRQQLQDVRADQTVTLHQDDAEPLEAAPEDPADPRLKTKAAAAIGLSFAHRENQFRDYRHEPLLSHKLSRPGPALVRGDVNGDGRDDVFVGGARGQASALFVQRADGSFARTSVETFEADANYEDTDAAFVDVDGDGDQDLYVVSGGSSEVRPQAYQDRLYLNDGTGALAPAPDWLPAIESSGGAVAAHDYDGDGDQDLFVGGRVRPNRYPMAPRSYLLENTGEGFRDATAEALQRPGMVADVHWADLTGDGARELILAGEWMPIRVFQRDGGGSFAEVTESLGLDQSNGWWNRLSVADLDGDGDLDIVGGNRGGNAQVRARPGEPASLYAGDFDQDGDLEPIMSHYVDGTEYPVPRRDQLMSEMSMLRVRFPSYESYAEATMKDVLTEKQWTMAQTFRAYTFTTSVFEQQDDGTFARHDLPTEAQFSPTHGIVVRDVNADDRPDLLLAGNDFTVREPWGPSDAGKGLLLVNRDSLQFEAHRPYESGFFAPGDVRDLLMVSTPDAPLVLVGNNDATLDLFELTRPPEEVAAR